MHPECAVARGLFGRIPVGILGAACVLACLATTGAAWAEEGPLELRLTLVSQTICPLDPLLGTVEYVNRSDHVLVIRFPVSRGGGATWLEAVPDGGQLGEPLDHLTGFFSRRGLEPGERVTSPTLWKDRTGGIATLAPGEYQVYARYWIKERTPPRDLESLPPEVLADWKALLAQPREDAVLACSEPVPLEVRWCDTSVTDRLDDLRQAEWLLGVHRKEEAINLFERCIAQGPACITRAALERLLSCLTRKNDAEGALAAARRVWALADTVPARESACTLLKSFVLENGHGAEAAEIVGDYKCLGYPYLVRDWLRKPHPPGAKEGPPEEPKPPAEEQAHPAPDDQATPIEEARPPAPPSVGTNAATSQPPPPPPSQARRDDDRRASWSVALAAVGVAGAIILGIALLRRSKRSPDAR